MSRGKPKRDAKARRFETQVGRLRRLVQQFDCLGTMPKDDAIARVRQFLERLETDDITTVASGLANWLEPTFVTRAGAESSVRSLLEEVVFDGSSVRNYCEERLSEARFLTEKNEEGEDRVEGSDRMMLGLVDKVLGSRGLERVRGPGRSHFDLVVVDDVWATGQTLYRRIKDAHDEIAGLGAWDQVRSVKILVLAVHEPYGRSITKLRNELGVPVDLTAGLTVRESSRMHGIPSEARALGWDVPDRLMPLDLPDAPFSGRRERELTTATLLAAGVSAMGAVRELNGPRAMDRPLGTDWRDTPSCGFGSPVITWRNCPNTSRVPSGPGRRHCSLVETVTPRAPSRVSSGRPTRLQIRSRG